MTSAGQLAGGQIGTAILRPVCEDGAGESAEWSGVGMEAAGTSCALT